MKAKWSVDVALQISIGGFAIIFVGIDVAKNMYEHFIINLEGVILAGVFTIPNTMERFNTLLDKLWT